jgi:hypothetical protein
MAADESAQVEYVVERVLENREAGVDLKRRAVLFRAGHHSDQLEVELARRSQRRVKLCAGGWGEFPASWENTGNSLDSGLRDAKFPTKTLKDQSLTSKIPYATEQGINSRVSGI